MDGFSVLIALTLISLWTPYLMAKGIESLSGHVSCATKIKCMIPIYNILRAEKNYYGSIKFCGISTILVFVLTIVKLSTWFFLNSMGQLNFITSILWLLSFVIVYIANCIFVYTVIHDADVMGGGKLLLYTIVYPIGQYYIGTQVAGAIARVEREAEAFRG